VTQIQSKDPTKYSRTKHG